MTSAQSSAVTMSPPSDPRRRLARALLLPFVRLVLALVVVSVAMSATRAILNLAGLAPARGVPRLPALLLTTVATIGVVHVAYLAYVRWLEGRAATELAKANAARELALGALVGALIFSAAIAVLAVGGWYRVAGTNPWTTALAPLLGAASAAYLEELIVRGILFRNLEEMLGSWLALAITAAIFGLAHLSNQNATLTGAIAIALEAGVLLGAAYMATGRLWLAIGIHFAWNFVQGGIFGVAVSGVASRGILRGELHGPALVTGASFGVEGSLIAVLVCLAAAVPLLMIAIRRGNVLAPAWRRPLDTRDVPHLGATTAVSSASVSGGGENP